MTQQPYAPGFVPPPQYGPPPAAVVINQVPAHFGDTPVRMVCPNCRADIQTRIETDCSIVQHIAFFVMCITGVCLLCSCVPYCISSLGDVKHKCPSCGAHLGSSKQCA